MLLWLSTKNLSVLAAVILNLSRVARTRGICLQKVFSQPHYIYIHDIFRIPVNRELRLGQGLSRFSVVNQSQCKITNQASFIGL